MTVWAAQTRNVALEPFDDGSYAIFNRDYWDSTLLHPIDAQLLQLLLATTKTMSEDVLICSAARESGYELDDAFRDYCGESLRQLAHIGLVVVVPEH